MTSGLALEYCSTRIRVLSLWQPWATLCVAPDPEYGGAPAKRHETRHWYPFEELPLAIAIHATKKFDRYNRDAFTAEPFRAALTRAGFYAGDPRPFTDRKMDAPGGRRLVPLGAIVGVARVVSIHCAETPPTAAIERGVQPLHLGDLSSDDRAFGYFLRHTEDPGGVRYAWRLADALMLPEPIAFSGRQEPLYDLDVGTLEQLHAQLRRAA